MVAEYQRDRPRPLQAAYARIERFFGDMRTPQSEAAFRSTLEDLPPDSLCVSVGGGPTRAHPSLTNLNIGAFPNVEIVADAYALPYADGAVDAFHCEAVLEHLEHPQTAVREMYRALRPGCMMFAATPFLQAFHGYPDHFQNFTLTGHRRLFEREGFVLISSGTCVGPTFAVRDLMVNYLRTVFPGGWIGKVISRFFALLTMPALWMDVFANRLPLAHQLASTTFVVARKPTA
jgi:SAM-dependent methyltransferase